MTLSSELASYLIDRAPEKIKRLLIDSDEVIDACGGNRWKLLGYAGFGSFNQDDLLAQVRNVFVSGNDGEIESEDGAKVKIHWDQSNLNLSFADDRKGGSIATPRDLHLLHPNQKVRQAAYQEMLEKFGVTGLSQIDWGPKIEAAPLTNAEIVQVFREIRSSVPIVSEGLIEGFLSGEVPEKKIIPQDIRYFEKLCGPLPNPGMGPEEYINGPLKRHREALLRDNLRDGIDVCSLGFLRGDLPPTFDFQNIETQTLFEIVNSLRPLRDPYTVLAFFELSVWRAGEDQNFLGLAKETIAKLISSKFLSTAKNDVYQLLPRVVAMVENRLAIMPTACIQPPYWRKIAAWMHAGIIVRCMDDLEFEEEQIFSWLEAQEVFEGTVKRMIDLQLEPRSPELIGGSFSLYAEMIGRLKGLANLKGKDGIDSELLDEFEEVIDERLSEVSIKAFLPGPLEGHLKIDAINPARALIPELREGLEKLSEAELSDPGWGVPRNAAQYFWIDDDIVSELKRSFAHARITEDESRETAFNSVASFAHFGAIRRDTEVANLVAEKCISEASCIVKPIEGRILAVLILISAAAHEDEQDYAKWLDRQLRILIDRLPAGEACSCAYDFIRSIRMVDNFTLGTLSQAEAAAMLGRG